MSHQARGVDAVVAVQTRDLTRVYRSRDRNPDVVALDGVSMDIKEGEIHGLLGPNGAGKTTLVKVLSTVLLPTSGSASILGHDVVRETAAVRARIGIVLGRDRGFYLRLTGRQNLEYCRAIQGARFYGCAARVGVVGASGPDRSSRLPRGDLFPRNEATPASCQRPGSRRSCSVSG